MSLENLVGLGLAVLLLVYLTWSLVHAEKL
jgi:hypothetical protein